MKKYTVFLPETPEEDSFRGLPLVGFGYTWPEEPPPAEQADEAWSLTIEDMMRMTSKSRRWLFENKHLPFIRQVSRKTLVGDKALLKKWIANRRAK
jgi:hypothetical protein